MGDDKGLPPVAQVVPAQPVVTSPVQVVPAQQNYQQPPPATGGNAFANAFNTNGPATNVAPVPASYGTKAAKVPKIQPGQQLGDISFLQGIDRILMRQRFEAIEALAQGLGCGCIEYQNKYDFYDANTGQPILYVQEDSDCLCRGFCSPHHTAKLHTYDARNGQNVPLYTSHKPFKCNCCVFCSVCQHNQKSVAGDKFLGEAAQPLPCGGYCKPTLDVKDVNRATEYQIVGPFCIFGGLLDLCVDQHFSIQKGNEEVGRLVHMKPGEAMEGLAQFVGDKDNYLLELPEGLEAEKTANFIGSMVLLDYLLFDDGGTCEPGDNGGIKINCFKMYCLGCIWPCTVELGGNNN